MSIEDGLVAARGIAQAQSEPTPAREQARIAALCAGIHARHRAGIRGGRLLLLTRPILERAWPKAALPDVGRDTFGPPPLLWAAVRLVFGRRPPSLERAT